MADHGTDAPSTRGAVRLRDGRQLSYAAWGPVRGQPVLFFSGAAMSCRLGFGTGAVEDLGVRLVAVDRPGTGGSDDHPARTLATWADDVGEVVRSLELGEPRAAAFSLGGPFALACADHLRAIALVSAQDDFCDPVTAALLAPEVRGFVDLAHTDPLALRRQVAQTTDVDGFMAFVEAMSSPTDVALYTEPTFRSAYRRALEEGLSAGADGYAHDVVLAQSPWPIAPEAVGIPVHLWYGTEDASTVHSPDGGARLAARLPRSTRHHVPGHGGSVLWTRGRQILEGLLRA